jgi:site-specific DNA-methyltransferase (adenine-specific)
MAVRQELPCYTKGKPDFNVKAEYTDIPKILRGYYKKANNRVTENIERGKSETIRPAMSGLTFSRCFIAWKKM